MKVKSKQNINGQRNSSYIRQSTPYHTPGNDKLLYQALSTTGSPHNTVHQEMINSNTNSSIQQAVHTILYTKLSYKSQSMPNHTPGNSKIYEPLVQRSIRTMSHTRKW